MTQELALSIIDRVKEMLQIFDDNSPLELLQLLRRYRNNFHPDKYSNENALKEANEKFVLIGCMIEELDSYVQREHINRSPKELALYQPLYENAALQTKLDTIVLENEDLKKRINYLENHAEDLKIELHKKQELEINAKQQELVSIYKPTNNKMYSLSFFVLLSAIIPILTKIELIAEMIRKYAPLSAAEINTAMFLIFICTILIASKKFIEYNLIKLKISEIKSPNFIQSFSKSLPNEKGFSESQVFEFLQGKKTGFKTLLTNLGFSIFSSGTLNQLKDVFIHDLLFKQLIDISYAEGLDRHFKIKVKPSYYNSIYD